MENENGFESNVAGWKLKENDDGTVTDWTNGRTGTIVEAGYSWNDVQWNEEEQE